MRRILISLYLALGLIAFQASAGQQADKSATTLAQIKTWLGGTYSNRTQVMAEETAGVPKEKRHMLLYQIVAPVSVDALDGLTYFDQLSQDGTENTLLSVGIYQFKADPESGTVKMRLLMFKDPKRYANAYLDPKKLSGVKLDELRWTDGCEFYLSPSEDGAELKGTMNESSCFPISRITGKKIHHIDELIIKPGQIWNKARYYDLNGKLLFGNSTGEFSKQIRIDK